MHMREYNKLSRYSILGLCVVGLTFPERGFITCIPDEIQWWCFRSPKLNSRKLHRVLTNRRRPASSCRSISILLFFIFPLSFIYVASFLAHHIVFFFAWNCGWLTFQKRDKFNLKRVDGFLPKNVTWFFVYNIFVRIGQNFQNEVPVERAILAYNCMLLHANIII